MQESDAACCDAPAQRWALSETQAKPFAAMYHEGHLDQLKQGCFYVGFRNGRIVTPDRIKARTAYTQINRVLKLARNTKDLPFLDVGEDGKWASAPADRDFVRSYMKIAEDAVDRLRAPLRPRARSTGKRYRRVPVCMDGAPALVPVPRGYLIWRVEPPPLTPPAGRDAARGCVGGRAAVCGLREGRGLRPVR